MADSQRQDSIRGVADIVFLIDATGSMEPCIESLKANIGTFIDSLVTGGTNAPSPVKDWRAKAVAFRDVGADGDAWFEDSPFVRDVGALKAQLAAIVAKGGGDEPESMLEGLYRVITMGQKDVPAQADEPHKWRARGQASRAVVIFTDASFKEPLEAPPEAKGATLDVDIKNLIVAHKISVHLFAPDMDCHERLSELQRVSWQAVARRGEDPVEGLRHFTTDQANFQRVLDNLAKTVSASAAAETIVA